MINEDNYFNLTRVLFHIYNTYLRESHKVLCGNMIYMIVKLHMYQFRN